jgi:predicted transcriptional regulator
MATTGNITLPDELLPKLQEEARVENKTADEVAAEAVKQHLSRRFFERIRREAALRRGDMTDEQIEDYVDRVIHDFRRENREH